MNLKLATPVNGNYKDVMARFDRKLFKALEPKGAKLEIVEFTGSRTGDKVHIRFVKPFKAEWISEITEHGEDESEAWFVDEGVKLPFGLSYWRHKHIVRKVTEDTSLIIDDITYKGSNILLSAFYYPAMFAGFYQRKKVYKAYFAEIKKNT